MTEDYRLKPTPSDSHVTDSSAVTVIGKDNKTLVNFYGPMSMYAAGAFISACRGKREDYLGVAAKALDTFIDELQVAKGGETAS